MNRREALLTTGSMFVSASIGAIACGGNNAVAQNAPPKAPPAPATGVNAEIAAAAAQCLAKGRACVEHCLGMFAAGDTSMGSCGKSSYEMHQVMLGLAAAANAGSPHLPALAKAAMAFCKDCEAACKPHADHHVVCRECMEACARTAAACAKIA